MKKIGRLYKFRMLHLIRVIKWERKPYWPTTVSTIPAKYEEVSGNKVHYTAQNLCLVRLIQIVFKWIQKT